MTACDAAGGRRRRRLIGLGHLEAAVPAMNGSVSTVQTALDLAFCRGLVRQVTGLELTGPDTRPVLTGADAPQGGRDTTLVVPLSATLTSGPSRVVRHALSTQNHKTSGTDRFTVAP